MSVKCFINDQTSQVRQEAEESTSKLSLRVSFSFPGNCHLKALLFIHFRMLYKTFLSNVAEMRQSNTTNRRWCETSEVEDEWALSYGTLAKELEFRNLIQSVTGTQIISQMEIETSKFEIIFTAWIAGYELIRGHLCTSPIARGHIYQTVDHGPSSQFLRSGTA